MASSIKMTFDEKNNQVSYNNSAGGGGTNDLIYNMKSTGPRREETWAEVHDKESKNHLTQMNTLNSNVKGTRSGSLKPVGTDSRFTTISDSYFNKSRHTQYSPKDQDLLKNHYKFHKGTTYSIGNPQGRSSSISNAQESFVPLKSFQGGDTLPGRRNQESMGLHNQNLKPNFAIGADASPSVRGSDDIKGVQNRSSSTYNQTLQGNFTN